MELYNSIIGKIPGYVDGIEAKHYDFSASGTWPETEGFEMVMMKDAAYELGGNGKPAVNFTCVTSSSSLVDRDEILLYGPDFKDIKGDVSYARIALVLTEDFASINGDDSEKTLRSIQDIDFTKYHVYPKGFMIRTSSESNREQVRVSKEALATGISFEKIGNSFIKHYKENPSVKAVKLIFITDGAANYPELVKTAKNVHDITMTLSKILEGMPTDCGSCNLKPICDEVEGMKELHFGKK